MHKHSSSTRYLSRTKMYQLYLVPWLVPLFASNTAISQEEQRDEIVYVLDPFSVQTDAVQGYLATTAMTATKVGTAIKDTPLNVQVMTSEFLNDAGLLNFEQITSYSSSFSQDAVNGSNFNSTLNQGQRGDPLGGSAISGDGRTGINPPNGIRLRAFPVSNILRNNLPRAGNHSLKGVDRVEVVKGPVAIFFGQSQPSGAINYLTKRPIDVYRYNVKTRVSSENLKAVELDANAPVTDDIGVRLMGSWTDTDGWRKFTDSTEEYIGLVMKWDPKPWITVILEGERIEQTANPGSTPIVTNPLYHNDYFNPPDEILFLPQDSAYGRNPWNRGRGREDTLRRWQQTILRNRSNWQAARLAAFPDGPLFYPSINQYFFEGVDTYTENIESFENAVADVYGPDANLAGPYGYSNDESEIAYYEISIRPLSWLQFKASGNIGEGARKFRLLGSNMPLGNMTFNGLAVNAGQQESEFTNHIFDMVVSMDIRGASLKFILGGEFRKNETVRWRADRSWSSELTQIYREWDPRTSNFPPLDEVYPLTTEDPDNLGIFDPANTIELLYNRSERLGGYIMHQGSFFGDRLKTMAGVRHEKQTDDSKGLFSTDWVESGSTSGTSMGAGLVYELTTWMNAYVSWNQNYQPNTRFSVNAPDVGDYNEQDLAERRWLDDETGTGIDLGIKIDALENKITAQFSYFETEREGIARLDYERSRQRMLDEGWTDDSFRVQYYVNGGLERARGFETEFLVTPLPGWQILGNYTYFFEANVISNPSLDGVSGEVILGSRLPNVSKERLSIWTKYEFQEGWAEGFSVGGGIRYGTSSKPFGSSIQYDITNDGYTVYDALLEYKFAALRGDWKVTVNIKNLTDELYSVGGLGFSPPRSWILSLGYTY